jgi:hypothetical protein
MNVCDQADATLTPNMPILRACDALESTKSQILRTPIKRKSQAEQLKKQKRKRTKHPLLQDYQHLEIWIRCSLNIVGVKCMLDITQTILVAVRVHQLLVSC